MVFVFACGKDEVVINETFYKIYDTALSSFTLKSLPTQDLGVLVMGATEFLPLDDPRPIYSAKLSKYDRLGSFQWEFQDTSSVGDFLMAEKDNYFILFHISKLNSSGQFTADAPPYSSLLYEKRIDKKTGKLLENITHPINAINPKHILKNGNYLDFNASQIGISSENLQIGNENNWDRRGNIIYLDESDKHFIFEERVDPDNTRITNFLTLASKDLSSISTICFSSLDGSLTSGKNIITNVYPFSDDEYIFVIYETSGLQPSIYFTPPISLKAEIESEVLKEPYFQKNHRIWSNDLLRKKIAMEMTEAPEITDLKEKYGEQFRYPLLIDSIKTMAARSGGTTYRTFDLDINDRETFIKEVNKRILIIRNSGSYQILIYEYLIAEKKFKLLQTLGRNIPYYIQDVSVNKNGDLFIVGNTNIGKELNSLFIIKLPYEDIVR